MARGPQARLRLTGLRLVVVALSAVGLITTNSALEIFRFGEVSAALHAETGRITDRQNALSDLTAALAALSVTDTPATLANLQDAARTLQSVAPDAADRLAPDLSAMRAAKAANAPLPAGLHDTLARLTETEAQALTAKTAEWDAASSALSQVLSLSLASIVVLLFTVVLRTLTYLSARDRSEAQLRRAMAEAEAANIAKTDFLATMSHEIRTPLTAIRGYSDLLATGPLNETQRDQLDRLRDANDTLGLLIDDILDLSRIEAGQFDLHPAPLDLRKLVDRVLSLVRPTALAKGLALDATVAPDVPQHILGDAGRLTQVLLNLTNNAVKFTPSGRVTLDARCGDGRLLLSVTDTGIGIAPDDIAKLFKRFSQIDSSLSRAHAGTGLGLAISRSLVQRMDGDITVTSAPAQGSRFTVSLPLVLAGPAAVSPPENPAEHPADGPAERQTATKTTAPDRYTHSGGARVLVVEDSAQNQDLIRAILSRDGHTCHSALDGVQGLSAAATGSFDLIVMDMQMPHMDGIAATAAIRALPAPQGCVPILAVSANALAHQVAAMAAAGADRHLAKPFAMADLSRAVAEMTGRKTCAPETAAVTGTGTDLGAFDDLVALLGRDWVRARLRDVLADLGWTRTLLAPSDLRRQSHRLIAEAGQLGLTTLAEAAARLEAALDTGFDSAACLQSLRAAAADAEAQLPRLLARLDANA